MLETSAAQRRPASSAIGVVALAIAWQAWLAIRRVVHRQDADESSRRSLASARRRRSSTVVVAVVFLAVLTVNAGSSLPGASIRGDAAANDLAPASDLTVGASDPAIVGGRLVDGRLVDGRLGALATPFISGPFLADGTLLKPVLIGDGVRGAMRGTIRLYTVRSGDTLTGIAARFGVSMMTLWWANSLASKDLLHVGQQLRVPPVSGLLYTVREGDALDAIAALTHADVTDIREFNGLTSDALVIGQVLMIPGGVGAPLPTPLPTPVPTPRPTAAPTAVPTAAPTAPPAQPIATMTGIASWMSIDGLAARLATGTLLRVCGAGGCIERRVTSWGPADTSRIVDLYSADFTVVCGCDLWVGLTEVRVDILPG